jgi:short-subunit dehydrogenase
MSNYFENKVVWVTGASSGIGAEMVKRLATLNAKIILSARRKTKLEELAQALNIQKEHYLVLPLDLAQTETFELAVNQVIEKFGSIDILINNAGLAYKAYGEETLEEVDRKIMEVNYFGPMLLTKKALPLLKKNKNSQVVVVSSILGEFGLPLVSAYAAAKHALHGYFDSLRYEVEKYKLHITLVTPGFINTEITYNSLTETGESYNQNSDAQAKGMDAQKCAQKILAATAKQKRFYRVGGIEIYMPLFEFFFPKIFYIIMKKLHKL